MPTEVPNQIPANSEGIAVELTDGTKVSSERAVRWFDAVSQEWKFQIELEGKQYLGKMLEDGKVELL